MSFVPRISQTPPPFDDENDENSLNNDEFEFNLNNNDNSNENSFNQEPNLDDFKEKYDESLSKNEEFTNIENFNENTNVNSDWANFTSFDAPKEVPSDQLNEPISKNDDDWGDWGASQNDGFDSAITNEEPKEDSLDLKINNLMNKIISDFETNFKLTSQSNDLTILNSNGQKLWHQLIDINNSDCLKFTWKSSKVEQLFLNSLNINAQTQKRTPSFNDILQPSKIDKLTQNKQKTENDNLLSVQTQQQQELEQQQQNIQQTNEVSFNLDLDLSYFENKIIQNTETNIQQQKQANRVLIEKLLDDIYPNSNAANLITVSDSDP